MRKINCKKKIHVCSLAKKTTITKVFGSKVEKKIYQKVHIPQTAEMAQQLRALAALSEVLSSIPSIHMVTHTVHSGI